MKIFASLVALPFVGFAFIFSFGLMAGHLKSRQWEPFFAYLIFSIMFGGIVASIIERLLASFGLIIQSG